MHTEHWLFSWTRTFSQVVQSLLLQIDAEGTPPVHPAFSHTCVLHNKQVQWMETMCHQRATSMDIHPSSLAKKRIYNMRVVHCRCHVKKEHRFKSKRRIVTTLVRSAEDR
jgi:hypothetical protein